MYSIHCTSPPAPSATDIVSHASFLTKLTNWFTSVIILNTSEALMEIMILSLLQAINSLGGNQTNSTADMFSVLVGGQTKGSSSQGPSGFHNISFVSPPTAGQYHVDVQLSGVGSVHGTPATVVVYSICEVLLCCAFILIPDIDPNIIPVITTRVLFWLCLYHHWEKLLRRPGYSCCGWCPNNYSFMDNYFNCCYSSLLLPCRWCGCQNSWWSTFYSKKHQCAGSTQPRFTCNVLMHNLWWSSLFDLHWQFLWLPVPGWVHFNQIRQCWSASQTRELCNWG